MHKSDSSCKSDAPEPCSSSQETCLGEPVGFARGISGVAMAASSHTERTMINAHLTMPSILWAYLIAPGAQSGLSSVAARWTAGNHFRRACQTASGPETCPNWVPVMDRVSALHGSF